MNEHTPRITEEPLTHWEADAIAHFERLSECEQRMYLVHLQDQFEATPSYAERWRGSLSSSSAENNPL
jgi:hypothetical protein